MISLTKCAADSIAMGTSKRWRGLLTCTFLVSGIAAAQVGSASIHGRVTDSSGAVLVGAAVTIKNVQTGTARSLKTDILGRYSAPELQIGEYQVQAEMQGFQT